MADLHTNWAYTLVDVAPIPAASGTTLSVSAGTGALFPTVPFNVVICPASTRPSTTNAEIVRVTSKGAGDNWTIVRTQEGSAARTIGVGDALTLAITVKTLTDAELTISAAAGTWPTGGSVQFSDANGVSFGIAGSTLTASVATGLTSQSNQAASASNGSFAFQTIAFSDGNNVTFGTSAGSIITASVNTGLTSQSNQAASASNGSFAFQTLAFSNGNNVTFGTSAGSIISASVNTGLTSQSNQAASASNGSFTFQTLGFSNANNVTFGTSAGSIVTASVAAAGGAFTGGMSTQGNTLGDTGLVTARLVLVGTNNITLSGSTNGGSMTISISGGAGGAGNTGFISAGGATASLGTVVFSNSNGNSFGVNGQTVTASHSVPVVSNALQSVGSATGSGTNTSRFAADDHVHAGVFSMGVSTGGNTAGNTRVDVGRFVFQGSNNISLSQSTAANALNTIIISGPATSAQQTGISGIQVSNTTYTSGTVTFQNANGASFGSSGANGVSLSYTVPTVTNSSWTVSAAADSGTVARLAFTNLNGITLSLSTGAGGSHTIVGSYTVPAAGLTQASAFAVSNTTQSSSGTIPLANFSFAGAGIASVGVSNGSVIISVPSGGGAGDGVVSLGMSTEGNTAGTTGTVSSGRYIMVGSGPISLSQSLNGQSGTLSILGPATSSLSATGLVSISTNGSTISIGVGSTLSALALGPMAGLGEVVPILSSISLGQNGLYVVPFKIYDYLTADHLKMPVFLTNSSSAAASVQKGVTFRVGIYSRHSTNATVITLMSSTSYTIAASHSSNNSWMLSIITAIGNSTSYSTLSTSSAGIALSSSLHGNRELILPFSSLLPPGEYFIGVAQSTSSAGAGGNVLNISNMIGSFHTFNRPGVVTNASNRGWLASMMAGTYSATTGALPNGISQTQVNQLGQLPVFLAGMGTT